MAHAKQKTQHKGTCLTDGCEEPRYCHDLCRACYQWDYYWQKKNAAERRAYIKRTDRTTQRVESLRGTTLRQIK